VEAVLAELLQAAPPFVIRLPRQAGRKDARYAQVFAGIPEFLPEEELSLSEEDSVRRAQARSSERPVPGNERVVRLEAKIGVLRSEAAELRQEVEELLAQFA
jgi:uncharacterized protein YceH (UPF0502 family)